jgi:hypothetical protein
VATESYAAQPANRPAPRAEVVLLVLSVLSLALIPVHITTIYSGLPAHPLFLHVPVILIPVVTICALALAVRPAWASRYGVALVALTVVALASLFITMGAGSALRSALHLGPASGANGPLGANGPAALIARHQHAANILRVLMIAFTAGLLATVFAHRIAGGMTVGRAGVDRLLARSATRGLLRGALAVLALACAYFVFNTGDLGAKAVWAGRLQGRGGGAPGPGLPGGAGGTRVPGAAGGAPAP